MTTTTTDSEVFYGGDGSTVAFQFDFPVDYSDEIRVELNSAPTLSFSVSLNADQIVDPGGTVTFFTAPGVGTRNVAIYRATPQTQQTAYPHRGPFPAAAHEGALDKLTRQVQELQAQVDRAYRAPRNTTLTAAQLEVPPSLEAHPTVTLATIAGPALPATEIDMLDLLTEYPGYSYYRLCFSMLEAAGAGGDDYILQVSQDGSTVLTDANYATNTGGAATTGLTGIEIPGSSNGLDDIVIDISSPARTDGRKSMVISHRCSELAPGQNYPEGWSTLNATYDGNDSAYTGFRLSAEATSNITAVGGIVLLGSNVPFIGA